MHAPSQIPACLPAETGLRTDVEKISTRFNGHNRLVFRFNIADCRPLDETIFTFIPTALNAVAFGPDDVAF